MDRKVSTVCKPPSSALTNQQVDVLFENQRNSNLRRVPQETSEIGRNYPFAIRSPIQPDLIALIRLNHFEVGKLKEKDLPSHDCLPDNTGGHYLQVLLPLGYGPQV